MSRLHAALCFCLLLLTGTGSAARADGSVQLPANQPYLFLVDAPHVWLSPDGGHTWQAADTGLPAAFHETALVGLSWDEPRALLATDAGAFRFAGGKWQALTLPQAEPVRQFLVLWDAAQSQESPPYWGYVQSVYALGTTHLWRSEGGLTWDLSPRPPGPVRRIAGGFDRARAVLYAQVGAKVYVRADRPTTDPRFSVPPVWVERDRGLGPSADQLIAALPNHPTWAYAVDGYNVWRTNDGGDDWSQIQRQPENPELSTDEIWAVGPPPGDLYMREESNDFRFPWKIDVAPSGQNWRAILLNDVFALCPFHPEAIFGVTWIRHGDGLIPGIEHRTAQGDPGWITVGPAPSPDGALAVACHVPMLFVQG